MSWTRRGLVVAAGVVACAVLTASQLPQTGTLNGDVVDISCGVLPGATVTARQLDGSVTSRASTNSAGRFSIDRIPAGDYELTATLAGFGTAKRTAIELRAGDTVSSSFAIDLGPTIYDSVPSPALARSTPAGIRPMCAPAEMSRGVIFVHATLDDNRAPVWLILDSGANVSVITDAVATSRAMTVRPAGETNGGIGEGRARVGRIPRLRIHVAGAEIDTTTAVTLPFGNAFDILDHVVDGVLGSDVFKQYVIRMDYATASVKFIDAPTFTYQGTGVSIPITLSGDLSNVPVTVDASGGPLAATVEVDTGNDGSVGLNRPFVDAHHLLDGRTTVAGFTMGVGGEATTTVGRLDTLRLGPFAFTNVVAGFSRATQGGTASSARDGILGSAILHRFTVFLDYPHRRMILEPNAHLGEAFDFDASGLVLARSGSAPVRVLSVRAGTPAADRGITAGDELTAIDGRPTNGLPLDTISRWLRRPDRDYHLTLQRGGRPVDVVLRTTRLI
jgi:hypothetical protein